MYLICSEIQVIFTSSQLISQNTVLISRMLVQLCPTSVGGGTLRRQSVPRATNKVKFLVIIKSLLCPIVSPVNFTLIKIIACYLRLA
jgi:hypothetical protein